MSQEECDHGLSFDEAEATKILEAAPNPKSVAEWLAGSPASREVRKRWPRLDGACPKGCGFSGIGYASYMHYLMGDW